MSSRRTIMSFLKIILVLILFLFVGCTPSEYIFDEEVVEEYTLDDCIEACVCTETSGFRDGDGKDKEFLCNDLCNKPQDFENTTKTYISNCEIFSSPEFDKMMKHFEVCEGVCKDHQGVAGVRPDLYSNKLICECYDDYEEVKYVYV